MWFLFRGGFDRNSGGGFGGFEGGMMGGFGGAKGFMVCIDTSQFLTSTHASRCLSK